MLGIQKDGLAEQRGKEEEEDKTRSFGD